MAIDCPECGKNSPLDDDGDLWCEHCGYYRDAKDLREDETRKIEMEKYRKEFGDLPFGFGGLWGALSRKRKHPIDEPPADEEVDPFKMGRDCPVCGGLIPSDDFAQSWGMKPGECSDCGEVFDDD